MHNNVRLYIIIALNIVTIFIQFCNNNLHLNSLYAMGEGTKFVFAQIKYRGGNWDPRPYAGKRLVWELIKQTSVEAGVETISVEPDDPAIFEYPFVYISGDREFEPFEGPAIENLRKFLEFGGILIVDDCLGRREIGFDKSMRHEIGRIFPDNKLARLPEDHAVYRSFFLIKQPSGRIAEYPYLEGITLNGRTVIIYSNNDMAGAWERDNLGNWGYEVIPGGEAQRKNAFRLGINLIMYALTGNYKQDQVHLPFILRRQM